MGKEVFKNMSKSTLLNGISAGATSLTVAAGEGSRFSALSSGNYFRAILIDEQGNYEFVKVTARTSDAMTVTRGQDGTSARAWSAGALIQQVATASTWGAMPQVVGTGSINGPASLGSGDMWTPIPTLTVSGAALGDFVVMSSSVDLEGMTLTGYVSAANTVSVALVNSTAGPPDPVTLTDPIFTALVLRY